MPSCANQPQRYILTRDVAEQTGDVPASALVGDEDNPPSLPPGTVDEEADTTQMEAEFLASISHELRSPLAAIKGYAATLRKYSSRLGRAERDEFLRAIEEASDRLEVLISRLLRLARLEAGVLTPKLTAINMVHLVREAVIAARQQWDGGSDVAPVYIFLAPEQDTMPLALADMQLQREVLDIVLENAVKYSPGGGIIRITIQTDNAMLLTRVEDRGLGIPSDHLSRIFERFHRVDTSLTREVEGAGLGLTIAKRIMELQHGDIWVESQPGIGSTFSMALPLAPPRDGSDDSAEYMVNAHEIG